MDVINTCTGMCTFFKMTHLFKQMGHFQKCTQIFKVTDNPDESLLVWCLHYVKIEKQMCACLCILPFDSMTYDNLF